MKSDKSIERHDSRTVLMNYGMSMVTGPHISEPHGGSMLVAPGCPARGYRGCEKKWFRTPAGFHVRTRSDGQKASFCDCSRVARRTCRSEAERQVALRAAAVLFIFPISPPVAASQQPGATDMEPRWGSHGERISHFLLTPTDRGRPPGGPFWEVRLPAARAARPAVGFYRKGYSGAVSEGAMGQEMTAPTPRSCRFCQQLRCAPRPTGTILFPSAFTDSGRRAR